MNRKKLLIQAQKLHLNTKESVLEKLVKESENFEQKFKHFQSIDTTNVKPLTRPIETPITWMRPDIPKSMNNKKIILSNAPQADKNYILVQKVVKND